MMGVSTGLKTRRPVKIEKPRPLKLASSVPAGDHSLEGVLGEMEAVSQQLQSGVWDHRLLYPAITSLCEDLKMYGPQLETVYKDQLDKCYIFLRTGCREDRLSLAARYRLLEIIELRAMNWKPNQNVSAYYLAKLQHAEAEEAAMLEQAKYDAAYLSATAASQASLAAMAAASLATTPLQTPTTPSAPMFPLQHPVVTASSAPHLPYGGGYAPHPQAMLPPAQPQQMYPGQYLHPVSTMTVEEYTQTMSQLQAAVPPAAPMLSPGEVVRTSGKFTKHNRVTGKNSCKDEVVIRNQDSGKVMGIKGKRVHMIEELSETIISFQRVAPGARERLVQITGPTEDHINQAKQLIEDTIRRNASPVREALSLSSGGSSVFSSSPLNGSNSSIASHDDDNNSLNGCKRGGMVYSLSVSDSGCGAEACSMGDYRYTVTHNNTALRIAGSNLSMVRTAKLVLDEYFNGERNLSNVVELLSGDSSPPLLVKPATPPATPPPSSTGSATPPPPASADDNPPEGIVKGDESPKNGGVAILRQPLFPSSSKEAVENAEGCSSGSAGARVRRAAFAKTSEERSSRLALSGRGVDDHE